MYSDVSFINFMCLINGQLINVCVPVRHKTAGWACNFWMPAGELSQTNNPLHSNLKSRITLLYPWNKYHILIGSQIYDISKL